MPAPVLEKPPVVDPVLESPPLPYADEPVRPSLLTPELPVVPVVPPVEEYPPVVVEVVVKRDPVEPELKEVSAGPRATP